MSAEYGTVHTEQRDEETPLITNTQELSCRQKFMRLTHQHRFRIIGTWAIVLAVAAVLTLSIHFALKDKTQGSADLVLDDMCVSDRSWFVALLLSIFLGPFGIDRFYLGYIFLGILKLVTAGLGGIWWIIDVILIAVDVLPDHPNGCHLR